MIAQDSYPAQHWNGCSCSACQVTFRRHNPSRHIVSCGCSGCQGRYKVQMETFRRDQIAKSFVAYKKGNDLNMASANFCERCNTVVRGRALGAVTLVLSVESGQYGTDGRVERAELCPACVRDLWTVYSVPADQVGERERIYSEPFDPDAEKHAARDDVQAASDEQLAAELFQRMMRKARTEIESGKVIDHES